MPLHFSTLGWPEKEKTLETQTESALSDYVKKFLLEFKNETGNFRYVDDIDNMMPSKSKFINTADVTNEERRKQSTKEMAGKGLLHGCVLYA